MFFLIYISIALRPMSPEDLTALLVQARAKNQEAGITGMLLYKGGNFLQVLEGTKEAVREVEQRIANDPRHHKMITLLEGPCDAREFSEWTMGFSNLDAPEVSAIPGYSEFMNTPLEHGVFASDPSRAQRLLRIFKQT